MIVPRILLFLTAVIWSWTFVATKVALEWMTPVELLGWRLLLGLPVLLLVILAKRLPIRYARVDIKWILAGSGIITVHFLAQITALKYTSATNTGWIIAVTPLAIAALSGLLLRERISRYQIVGILVATLGILVLVSGGEFQSLDWLKSGGDWVILGTAFSWALYTICLRKISNQSHPLVVTFGVLVPSMIPVITYMLFTSDLNKFLILDTEATVAVLFLAVLGMAVALWFWQEGVNKLGPTRAGFFIYLMPLSTTALAVPYLGERFDSFTLAGGIIVLAAVVWAERMTARDLRRPQGRP